MSNCLIDGFINTTLRFPNHRALEIKDQQWTYQELSACVGTLTATLLEYEREAQPLISILASRSLTAYAGILAILAAGKGYTPLNPNFPIQRTSKMLALAESQILIVGTEAVSLLEELLPLLENPQTLIFPETSDLKDLPQRFPEHLFLSQSLLSQGTSTLSSPQVEPSDIAYLLFTSGSTGIPKGVPISHQNVRAYLETICEQYPIHENDRCSQMFDLTFDLSVHDLFICWERGACLCVVPQASLMGPAKFIREKQLTLWFSVPSVVMFMAKMKMLKPNAFPTLRYSFFCGEALPVSSVQAWQQAAFHSKIDNLYGPTEATIAITRFPWTEASQASCLNGIVPIGWIFESQHGCVIASNRKEVQVGEVGELCLSGTQISRGYLNNVEQNSSKFITLADRKDALWYRTGDLVKQGADGCLYYLGRLDDQVQIRGHRVELQEVDHVLRNLTGCDLIASVPKKSEGSVEALVAFIGEKTAADERTLIQQCKQRLPEYMVPQRIYFIHEMPLNVNGKIDRSQLMKILEEF
ncbi:amino acid adenylation domain-containing protein [Deltaproteobacteria bacterium TL4]